MPRDFKSGHSWFKQLFESSPDPTWIIEGNRFVECNEAAIKTLGYTNREELLNVHPSKLSPPSQPDGEDSFTKAERMMAIAKDKGLHRFEWVHTRVDGSNFIAEVTLSSLTFDDRSLIYCVWRDITERKRTEELLQKSEATIKGVLEGAADAIFIADHQGRYQYVNRVAVQLLGYTRDELLRMGILDLTPAEDHAKILHDFQSLLEQGSLLGEIRLKCKNGRIIPTELNAAVLADGSAFGSCRDITERKQMEAPRNEALDRLQKIAGQLPGVVFQFCMRPDGSSCLPYASESFHKIFRVDPDELRVDASPIFAPVHPDDLPGLKASMETSARDLTHWQHEYRLKFKDEPDIWLLGSAIPQREADGSVLWHGFVTDITERKMVENRIAHMAHHDTLTGLLNRFSLMGRLEQALATARRDQRPLAVMFLDMDRFKTTNDTLGHATGDKLLVEVARRLGEIVRNSDIVARLGGDEFVVVLTEVENAPSAARVADKILKSLGQSYFIGKHEIHSTPSIGLSYFPADGDDSETLMRNADLAMYHAKSQGRNNIQFFTREMNLLTMKRLRLEHDMRVALTLGQFELNYQPQLDGRTGQFVGVEALLRWCNPQDGMVLPLEFIQVAEETGLILPLGEWILDEACRQLREWRNQGVSDIRMAVNLSALQLRSPTLLAFVSHTLEKHDLTGDDLELEITESAVMDDPQACIRKLNELRKMGVRLSIDDFGTGYSSLSHLKLMPIHTLKIDQSFVRDIETDANDVAICTATIAMAHSLGLSVIAEGVETEAQRDFLLAHHCDFLQGFLFSKPLQSEALLNFFNSR